MENTSNLNGAKTVTNYERSSHRRRQFNELNKTL